MRLDKNTRLCSKDVQSRLRVIVDVLTRDSLDYIIKHNLIERAAIERALTAASELVTNKRTCQLGIDT
jgi:hypothetical protein